jgi:autotransporter family porin
VLLALVVATAAGCSSPHHRVAGSPDPGGYFRTLPPGAPLPTGAQCATRVHRSPWEPKKDNRAANHTVRPQPVRLPPDKNFDAEYQTKYRTRIDGAFTGTTDEIIQWASCKWGISDDLIRAQAQHESKWHQSATGDNESRSDGHCPPDQDGNPCPTSFGLLQSKWYFRPGTYPWTRTSTAFMVDSALAETRGCLDGLGYSGAKTRGDIWGCIGFWYSGEFGKNDADYIADVKKKLEKKAWIYWGG